MLKKLLVILTFVSVLLVSGCSSMPSLPSAASTPSYDIVRKSEVSDGKWQMYQLRIELGKEEELPILLKLGDGDKVDGYFYVEKGSDLDVRIAGKSQIYDFTAPAKADQVSDRFSFTASQVQGNMYILTLSNTSGGDKDRVTTFLELVYPSSGSIFIPLELKK